mmetsp:Transcript_62473/g.116071  ORF Transcript_62473/g.116071 Transcript_62473/m.116071 type:complete len:528 (-) Transcript_62473:56-1639(-)
MANYCPVVLTACQEAEKLKPKTWNTKYKLWKLKINEPHLFAHADASASVEGQPRKEDTSFKPITLPGGRGPSGWYWHAEKQFYFEKAAERCLWLDPSTGLHHELHVGDDFSSELSLTGSATSKPPPPAATPSSSKPAAAPPAASSAARHLMILDLHKAAEVFKLESLHLPRPAAMLAVYHACEGGLPPETAAKTLHEKLLRKLAAHRSKWSTEALQAVLVESMQAVAEEHKCPSGVGAAVALILGLQLVVAASQGSACIVADPLPDNIRDVRAVCASAPGPEVCTAVVELDVRSAACIMLQTGAGLSEGTEGSKVYNEDAARTAAAHATRGRSRAGCAALLRGMDSSRGGNRASNAAACLQLQWTSSADVDDETRPAKRAKTSTAEGSKDRVRCRQILLKHAGCKAPRDPVRRKAIQRSVAEAEAGLLDILEELEAARSSAAGASAAEEIFTKKCRAVSECTSSLKGGDLAGDIGWLRLPEVRVGERLTKEQAVKMAFVKSAMALDIGEVSDIISSEDGLHLLKRTA